jgi:flagellar basal body rod protein FlgG
MDPLAIAAVSGLRSRIQSLDLLANNLANTGTSGYKGDQEFYSLFNSEQASGADGGPGATLSVIQRQWTDFSQGTFQQTGNSLDVALAGKGFFVVTGPNGPLYTRNGSLQVLPSGELAVAGKYALQDSAGNAIHVTSGKPIQISGDGTVQQDGSTLGQIKVVNLPATDSLQKVGDACFQDTDSNNRPVVATGVEVQQGKIEQSNVPVAGSAMRLVGVMRQFEMLQKAIAIGNEMDTKAIQEVARVG